MWYGAKKKLHPRLMSGVKFDNSTVPPCLQEALNRREQCGWTEVRARGGPQGPDTSPNRREAARREQVKRDSLPLVSSVTGGPGLLLADGSGVVRPVRAQDTSSKCVPLCPRRIRFLLRQR